MVELLLCEVNRDSQSKIKALQDTGVHVLHATAII